MALAAGLRNLIVHRYGDIDLHLFAQAVPEIVEPFGSYVTHIARWMSALDHGR